jgi:hypothetical protein
MSAASGLLPVRLRANIVPRRVKSYLKKLSRSIKVYARARHVPRLSALLSDFALPLEMLSGKHALTNLQ